MILPSHFVKFSLPGQSHLRCQESLRNLPSLQRRLLVIVEDSLRAVTAFLTNAFPSLGRQRFKNQTLQLWNGRCQALTTPEALVAFNKRTDNPIPGTIIFDGQKAIKGYALNKMCFSFNSAENREEYLRDEDAYCDKYNLTQEQKQALKKRNVLDLLAAGGNIYYLAKWAGIFGMNVQQIGAQQRGMTEDQFKELLVRAGGN